MFMKRSIRYKENTRARETPTRLSVCVNEMKYPRTRSAAARQVSNAHERAAADLVRGRFIAECRETTEPQTTKPTNFDLRVLVGVSGMSGSDSESGEIFL